MQYNWRASNILKCQVLCTLAWEGGWMVAIAPKIAMQCCFLRIETDVALYLCTHWCIRFKSLLWVDNTFLSLPSSIPLPSLFFSGPLSSLMW